MQWYWEGTHYSKELGDRVLSRIFAMGRGKDDLPEDFGLPFTSENAEEHLAHIRQSRKNYVETHPGEINEIMKIVKSLQKRKNDG